MRLGKELTRMKRLGKCPKCNVKPRHWIIEATCETCSEPSEVYINPNVIYGTNTYTKVVKRALQRLAGVKEPEPKSRLKRARVKKPKKR